MLIGQRITEIMKSKNMIPADVLKKCNGIVSQPYFSQILKGKYNDPAFSKVQAIAKALGMGTDKLSKDVTFI